MMNSVRGRADVREMWDEFVAKQDEPLYIRNALSGLSGIMLVSRTG